MADLAVRLVPDFPDWSAKQFSNAYFMVGRYEDALGMLERLSPDNDTLSTRTTRAAALAAVSQNKEAQAVGRENHSRASGSDEREHRRGYGESERLRLTETMRLAGFPPAQNQKRWPVWKSLFACRSASSAESS